MWGCPSDRHNRYHHQTTTVRSNRYRTPVTFFLNKHCAASRHCARTSHRHHRLQGFHAQTNKRRCRLFVAVELASGRPPAANTASPPPQQPSRPPSPDFAFLTTLFDWHNCVACEPDLRTCPRLHPRGLKTEIYGCLAAWGLSCQATSRTQRFVRKHPAIRSLLCGQILTFSPPTGYSVSISETHSFGLTPPQILSYGQDEATQTARAAATARSQRLFRDPKLLRVLVAARLRFRGFHPV